MESKRVTPGKDYDSDLQHVSCARATKAAGEEGQTSERQLCVEAHDVRMLVFEKMRRHEERFGNIENTWS
jgi:hypothetical protein